MTGIQVVSWVKPKAVLSLASEPSYCLACCSPLDCSARTLQGEIHYVCQEYHSSQPEVSAALERTCAVPRLLDYHVFCITGIASARAAMQNVLQFDVCYGCSWYLQPGEFIEGSVKYPVTVTAEDLGAAMMEEDMKTTADLQHKVKDDGRE
ncbi:uncharacterized protein LOC119170446 isoform X10 [Rhipicephalus microplus]|uniref:uncharacterized protein LOC119170446 isoform X10 n=1 Tax=Rhipicephalus microplus TaxID=6941 RepID=UPI003F6BC3F0